MFHKKIINYIRIRKSLTLIGTVLGVATVGTLLLTFSHAATPTVSIEPETGTPTGCVSSLSDSPASGGQAVKFGSCVTPPPTIGTPQWLGDYQTGDFSQWPAQEYKDASNGGSLADLARQQQVAHTFTDGAYTVPARAGFP